MDNLPFGLTLDFPKFCKDCILFVMQTNQERDLMGRKETVITCEHKEVCEYWKHQ